MANENVAEIGDLKQWLGSMRGLLEENHFHVENLLITEAGPVLAASRFVDPAWPLVYLSSGIHGDEPAGPLAIESLLRHLDLDGFNWLICPLLNPLGLNRGIRENPQGIDLNRDYRRQQSREARAHAAWLERQLVPDLFVSLHEDWEAQGFYFYEIALEEDRPERARRILDSVAAVWPIEQEDCIDDHQVRERGWIFHEPQADFPDEWPEAIFMAERRCPLSFTFETPSRAAPLEKRIAAHQAAIAAALLEWQAERL